MKNKSYLVGFITNLVLALLASIGLIIQLFQTPTGEVFKYYTILSNTLCIVISLTVSAFHGINTFIRPVKIPRVISIIKHVNVLMLLVTFLTVICVLWWCTDFTLFELLFTGSMLYHHTLVPLIAIVSFIFYEKHDLKPFWTTFIPSVFTLIYGIVFMILDATDVLKAPYPFLAVTNHPLYFTIPIIIGVFALTYAGAFLLRLLNKKLCTIKD